MMPRPRRSTRSRPAAGYPERSGWQSRSQTAKTWPGGSSRPTPRRPQQTRRHGLQRSRLSSGGRQYDARRPAAAARRRADTTVPGPATPSRDHARPDDRARLTHLRSSNFEARWGARNHYGATGARRCCPGCQQHAATRACEPAPGRRTPGSDADACRSSATCHAQRPVLRGQIPPTNRQRMIKRPDRLPAIRPLTCTSW
jgi:hypothetical protein